MDMLLKGKRALITGSTSGIGAQCARVLAGEGVSVVINGRSADRAAAVTEEIRKVGGEAKFVLGDVTTEDGSNAVVEGAKSAFDGIDILVKDVGNPTQESHDSWFDAPVQEWIDDYHQNTIAAVPNGPCLYSGNERARLGAFDPSLVSKRYLATRASADLRRREGRAQQRDPQSV
jgi:3-oxoacyl-[acyl-carrier protein] reductase